MPDDVKDKTEEKPPIEIEGVSIDAGEAESSAVKRWTRRIKSAREKFKPDHERMRKNMEFCFGLQWDQQKDLRDSRYTANLTNKAVNSKVAMLYAKDPKAVFRRRKRPQVRIPRPSCLLQQEGYRKNQRWKF